MSDPTIDSLRTLGPYLFSLEPDIERRSVLERLFNEQVDLLEKQYKAAKDDKTKQDDFRRFQEAFAKGLPAFAAGVIGAVKGFQSGDNVAGTAAVMDSLASMATMMGAMAGPEGAAVGAVVGAFVSVISMILKCFSDQKPARSLAAQLDEVIRAHDAEQKIQDLKSAQNGMEAFIDSINQGTDTRTYSEILQTFALHAGSAMQKILGAAEWIEEPKNQELAQWGETLTAQCYAYVSFLQSFAIAMRVAKTNQDLTNLVADILSHHPQQVKFLEAIKPAARNRGTIWRIGAPNVATYYNQSSGSLAVRDAVHSKSDWKDAGGFMRAIAVTTRKGGLSDGPLSPRQLLAVFHLEPEQFRTFDNEWDFTASRDHPFLKNNRSYGLFGRWPAIASGKYSQMEVAAGQHGQPLTGCYDIWALPGGHEHEVYLYTADGDALACYVQSGIEHDKDEDKRLRLVWRDPVPPGYKAGEVRAVFPKPLPDEDPEAWLGVGVVYAACEVAKGMSQFNDGLHGLDHMELRVLYLDQDKPLARYNFNCSFWINGGRNFKGIAVDSSYLWVYGSATITCVTHSDLRHAVERNSKIPWMHHEIPRDVGNYDLSQPIMDGTSYATGGLLGLSSCDDGTLTAVFVNDRSRLRWPHIYSLTPRIDHRAGSLVVAGTKEDSDGHLIPTNGWETDLDGATQRAIKQPIFCWGLIEGLIANLQLTAAPGAIHLRTDKTTGLVTVKNSSPGAMTLEVEVAGDSPDDFMVSHKSGDPIGPGGLAQVAVEFKPKRVEAGKTSLAILWIESGRSRASVVMYGTQ